MRTPAAAAAVMAVVAGGLLAPAAPASVLVVGDSLGAGTDAPLRAALPGFEVESDNRNGRPSSEGVAALDEHLRPEHDTVVFDLGTNDGPGLSALTAASLAAAHGLAGGRCLVIATLHRPPITGIPVDGQNTAIRRFAAATPTVVLVDWHAAADSRVGLLRGDGVHATPAGYALRGGMFADAVRRCATGDELPPPGARRASRTGRPADRRASPLVPAAILPSLTGSLAAEHGPLDVAVEVGATVAGAATALARVLTPRGPEPVLGAPY